MENLDDSVFQTLHDQYNKIKTLQKNDKIGTETEPPWNVNEAKILLDTMASNLDNLMDCVQKDNNLFYRLLAMKCTLWYEKAKFLINIENEEQAQEEMSRTLIMMKDHFMKPEFIFLVLRVTNHYSFLLSKQGESNKPQKLLEEADEMYKAFKSKNENPNFYTGDDLFLPQSSILSRKESVDKLERIVTNNLLMLSSIHNKQGNHEKFAFYNHNVLKRQLETREGEATTWATKAAKLASYFLTKNRFREARHHLAAACHVLEEFETELKNSEPSKANISKWEEIQLKFADIAKCWVVYGLILFNVSKTRLVSLFYGEPNEFLENLWLSPFDIYSQDIHPECQNTVTDQTQELLLKDKEKPTAEKDKSSVPLSDLETESKLQESEYVSSDPYISTEQTLVEKPDQGGNSEKISIHNNTEQPVDQDTFRVLFTKPESKENSSFGDIQDPLDVTDQVECENESHHNVMNQNEENLLLFQSLDLSDKEKLVSAGMIENTEQARAHFLYTHSWLKRSKMFYTLKDHPMEYVNAILDLSELYRYLSFYEEDIESQYSVQKRRADALETLSAVLREVRPQCYMAVSVELLRELAEVQLEMMGLNLRRLYAAHETATTPHHTPTTDFTLHKMEALADIHSRLEQFGDSLGNGAQIGDGLSDVSTAEMSGDSLPYYI